MKSCTTCLDMWRPLTSHRMNGERNGTKIDGSETTTLNWLMKIGPRVSFGPGGNKSPTAELKQRLVENNIYAGGNFMWKIRGSFLLGIGAKLDRIMFSGKWEVFCIVLLCESHWMRSSSSWSSSSSPSPLKEKPLHFPPPTLRSFFLQRNNTKAKEQDFITSIIPFIPTHPSKIWMGALPTGP